MTIENGNKPFIVRQKPDGTQMLMIYDRNLPLARRIPILESYYEIQPGQIEGVLARMDRFLLGQSIDEGDWEIRYQLRNRKPHALFTKMLRELPAQRPMSVDHIKRVLELKVLDIVRRNNPEADEATVSRLSGPYWKTLLGTYNYKG